MGQPIDFPATDTPLRDDVRTLGAMLGELLVDLEGRPLFDSVESIRRTARARRLGDRTAADRLAAFLHRNEASHVRTVVRAFGAYFGLINMAERVHRIRRRRDFERDETPQPGGVRAILTELADKGFTHERLTEALAKMRIEPVFTAHPSEAIRRTLLRKEQRIAYALVDRFDRACMTPREDRAALGRIRGEVASSWATSEHGGRPTVHDEVEHVAFYLVAVIYRAVPAFFEELEDAMHDLWPNQPWRAPSGLLRFGSWVGGDMDGNPNVGAETFEATLRRQRKLVLDRYAEELRALADHLSQSVQQVSVDPAITDLVARYRELLPEAAASLSERYHDMPYQNLSLLMAARIEATQVGAEGGYAKASDFLDDVVTIEETLQTISAEAGAYRVRRLRRRAETFGFHLATLDIRQDSLVHRQAVGDLLGHADFVDLDAAERTRLILEALEGDVAKPTNPGEALAKTLAVLEAVGRAQQSYSEHAVGPYIISMARGADDTLAVLLLAKAAGLAKPDGTIPLDIAPLFETADDLHGARATMTTLYEEPLYRAHLKARGDQQMVMVGYSDSNKDAGIMAARWALQQGQAALVEVCEAAGVGLTVFHGRGGTISRGGTKTREAVLAAPAGSVGGRLRMTEQGEIIHARYGLRGIALRSLELATGAVLQRTSGSVPRDLLEPNDAQAALMTTMSSASRKAYRALVEDPRFLQYFRSATPIDVIERMAIGSRPSKRREQAGLNDLRAIPWVFAWNQSRHIMPGWFGVGSGLQAAIDQTSLEDVQRLATEWPFFDTLLADVEMVLAKTDLEIAESYAGLADETSRGVFDLIAEEHHRTRSLILEVRGADHLLEREEGLYRTLRLRNPYIDPMSFAQVELLRAWRAEGRPEGDRLDALFSTVKGIARGLQNTG
ncbi:MAG: phosphoenolpyruvate carboxylase [Deltaproteobacteria bacterium]|nr:phosphoenolpyruvate carboxylase [Deltaproteobacteria bacterium]